MALRKYLCIFIPATLQVLHIIDPHAEDEHVLLPSLLRHLHVGAVHGADGQRPVQHELHIASAGRLRASS